MPAPNPADRARCTACFRVCQSSAPHVCTARALPQDAGSIATTPGESRWRRILERARSLPPPPHATEDAVRLFGDESAVAATFGDGRTARDNPAAAHATAQRRDEEARRDALCRKAARLERQLQYWTTPREDDDPEHVSLRVLEILEALDDLRSARRTSDHAPQSTTTTTTTTTTTSTETAIAAVGTAPAAAASEAAVRARRHSREPHGGRMPAWADRTTLAQGPGAAGGSSVVGARANPVVLSRYWPPARRDDAGHGRMRTGVATRLGVDRFRVLDDGDDDDADDDDVVYIGTRAPAATATAGAVGTGATDDEDGDLQRALLESLRESAAAADTVKTDRGAAHLPDAGDAGDGQRSTECRAADEA